MTSVWGRGCTCQKCPSVALPNSSLPLESKLFDQLIGPLRAKFFIAVVPATALAVLKYNKKYLQQIFKTVLQAQAPTISEEPWDKLLKAYSLDVYYGKFYMKYYNLCQ